MKLESYLHFCPLVGTAGQPDCLSAVTQVCFPSVFVKVVRQWEESQTGPALFQYCLQLGALRACSSEFITGDSEVQARESLWDACGVFPQGWTLRKRGWYTSVLYTLGFHVEFDEGKSTALLYGFLRLQARGQKRPARNRIKEEILDLHKSVMKQ